MFRYLLIGLMFSSVLHAQARADSNYLQTFANVFFAWRSLQQPCGPDDIPRVTRPAGWTPRVSPADLTYYRQFIQDARIKLKSYEKHLASRQDSITYLLLRSAIERVHWELNILRQPNRNPDFYVHQTLGAVYELLLVGSPMTGERIEEILTRMRSIPATLRDARKNLSDPIRVFADIAIGNLDAVDSKLKHCTDALIDVTAPAYHAQLRKASDSASSALLEYREWLGRRRASMSDDFSLGRDRYEYFLKYIALIPHTPEELILQGRLEWNRAVAFETLEEYRNRKLAADPIFASIDEQIARQKKDEADIRKFLEQHNIMTVPKNVGHYLHRPIPEYLKPFTYLGVPDDLTSEFRLDENGCHFIPPPSERLPFFYRATAQDPRPLIVHEGIPGHYFQLVRSWQNPDPLRRRYFDSGANEGIGFYVEEMLLQQGLFDDRPRTREIIFRFMRLRALRVEIDIRLALGDFNVENAASYLERTVPMDHETARSEAGFFAYNPGQAITYQIGKNQIHRFLADARLQKGASFSLKDFHDYLMVNGNVPLALLRWEYTGLDDEIKQLWK